MLPNHSGKKWIISTKKGITLNKRTDRSNKGLLTTAIIAAIALAGCTSSGKDRGEIIKPPSVDRPVTEGKPSKAAWTLPQSNLTDDAGSAQPTQASQTDQSIELQPSAPEQYTVKKGDTLWDISAHFLVKPWYWPEIWQVNPEIRNPHLIYPGDVISLYYVNGKPRLGVNRQGDKLSPSIRTYELEDKDIGVPVHTIRPFLIRPQVVSEEELKRAAHIVDSQENHLIYGSGDKVYARGLDNPMIGSRHSVFRPGKPLLDPVTGEHLGFEATYTSDAEVTRITGELATIKLHNSVREVLRGDRLLPLEMESNELYFIPHPPPPGTEGRVISFYDALSQVAQYQVVVINLGQNQNIEPGHVFAVNQAGRVIQDVHHREDQRKQIALPMERSGTMMIFRSFEKVSYGLIMESELPMRIGDIVTAP